MAAPSSTLSRVTGLAAITLFLTGALFLLAVSPADAASNQQASISGNASAISTVTIGASSGNTTVISQSGGGNQLSSSRSRSRTGIFSTSFTQGFNIFSIWQF